MPPIARREVFVGRRCSFPVARQLAPVVAQEPDPSIFVPPTSMPIRTPPPSHRPGENAIGTAPRAHAGEWLTIAAWGYGDGSRVCW